jgi:flagella basal body P-ring formation protein FlgA
MDKILFFALSLFVLADPAPVKPNGEAEASILSVIQEQVKKECETCQVEVILHNPRLLQDVAIPDRVLAEHWRGQTNLILQLGAENRIITATIRWIDEVVIASKNIRQGQLMEKRDLKLVKKDVTFIQTPYLNQIKQVAGWEPRKMFRRGQVIDEGYLKRPLAVKYGQPLRILLQEGALQLSMTGQAKGAGAVGERIPIYLPETRRRLSGIIVEKGVVRVQ